MTRPAAALTYEQATHTAPRAYEVRVARKGKRCTDCGERIPAGSRYALLSLWRWTCMPCAKTTEEN